MSDTSTNLADNLGVAVSNLGFARAQLDLPGPDYASVARFVGKASAALDLVLNDVVDLAPDPLAAQAAFDAGKVE